jgi:hypothetical protein
MVEDLHGAGEAFQPSNREARNSVDHHDRDPV